MRSEEDRQEQTEFAAGLIARLAGRGGATRFVFDEETFSLRGAGDVVPLANVYREASQAGPLRRRRVISDFVARLASTANVGVVEGRLVPSIAPRLALQVTERQARLTGGSVPGRPHVVVGEHWVCSIAVDGEHAFRHLLAPDIERTGSSFETNLATAVSELARRSSTRQFRRLSPGLYCSEFDDNLAAARVMLPELLTSLRVKGSPVVAIADRDTLLVCGDNDRDAVTSMVTAVQSRLEKSTRPMNGRMMRWRNGSWSPYLPEPDAPGRRLARDLATLASAADYAQQQAWLQADLGNDVYVAGYGVRERSDSPMFSHCAWSKGVTQSIPQTDFVALVSDPDGDHPHEPRPFLVTWQQASETVGTMMQQQDLYPPRYFITDFPSPAQIEHLSSTETSVRVQ